MMDERVVQQLLDDMAHLQQDPQYRWMLERIRAEIAAAAEPLAEATDSSTELYLQAV